VLRIWPGFLTLFAIFDSLMTNFWVKNVLAKTFSLAFKNKIICNFMIFVATENGRTKINFFPPPLLVLLLDPGSRMD
jgi:hypothetical protein